MQHHIDILTSLHQGLLEALEAGDVARIDQLVDERGHALEDFMNAFLHATPTEQDAIQPSVQRLQALDGELQELGRKVRDQVSAELNGSRQRATRQQPAPTMTGIFDRQA